MVLISVHISGFDKQLTNRQTVYFILKRRKDIIYEKKLISIFLSLLIVFNISIPVATASENENKDYSELVICGTYAAYMYNSDEYRYCVYLNTASGNGSFAIGHTKLSNYVYEYYFTVDSATIDIQNPNYWDEIVENCFTHSASWSAIDLAKAFTPEIESEMETLHTGSCTCEQRLMEKLKALAGGSAYSNKVLATSYRENNVILHLYEDCYFTVSPYSEMTLAQAMSVAGLIVSGLSLIISPGLLSLLGAIASVGGLIPAGTKVETYHAEKHWERNVRRKDSGILHNQSTRIERYDAYIVCSSGFCEIHEESKSIVYSYTQSYFDDYAAQLDDGYEYYLTT